MLDLFYTLRGMGVETSPTEWLTLMSAMDKGLHNHNVDDFYYLARSLLIKDVALYDAYDQAFTHVFQGGDIPDNLATKDDILRWLEEGLEQKLLTAEELEQLKHYSLEELLKELQKRLEEQTGPHHGGHHWIGTGGTSPFGSGGSHPTGISFDPEGGGRGAVLQAFKRKYRNMRDDITLDVRQMTVALKKLRQLKNTGAEETLDLDATIEKTCKNAGDIEMVFGRERENQVRLLLVMDTGGSMEPYRRLCERLFSAASSLNHFKEFKAYYFHNCIYDNVYEDVEADKFVTTDDLIKNRSQEHRLVVVGDAAMAPYELLIPNGFLETRRTSRIKGVDRLRMLSRAFPKRVWLNPISERSWSYYDTIATVGGLFPMYPLTVSGLGRAIKDLL